MTVTLYQSFAETKTPFHKSIEFALKRIKEGASKVTVEAIRAETTKDKRDNLKMKLPCINFQGKFVERKDSGLTEFSGLMPLDYDKIPTENELLELHSVLSKSPFTFALFLSPSGNGLKQIIRVPPDGREKYKAYFSAAQEHFASPFFDVSNSNISRVCFESYDADLYYNPNAEIFTQCEEYEYTELGIEQPVFRITSDNRIIENLLTWFHKKYRVIEGERNANLFKLAAAFNQFGIKHNDALHTLRSFQTRGFDAREIENICKSAYKNKSEYNTRHFEDNETKDKVSRFVRQGMTAKEIITVMPEVEAKDIEQAAGNIRSNIKVEHFLYFNDNGRVQLDALKYRFWLEHHKFAKYFPEKSKTYTFVKIEGKIIEETTEDRIKDYVLEFLMKDKDGSDKFYNYMANNTKYFKTDFLNQIQSFDAKIEKDTQKSGYIYYRNCIVKVTAQGREIIDYFDVKGYVWRNQILDRDYVKMSGETSIYRKFIWLVSGQNEARYKSLQSVIGYLLHSFKTSGTGNRAIILNDGAISDNPNGGSGKGIFCAAISHMKKLDKLNGKGLDITRTFSFQTVSFDCQVLIFDDVEKNFNFEKLFSIITEGITLERKGQHAVFIPSEESPKIGITTNWTIGGTGGSHDRRKFEVEFSSYFNAEHTPIKEFGVELFSKKPRGEYDDVQGEWWSVEEWHKFDNYMLECYQLYMQEGLIYADYDNVEVKKFMRNTSNEFYEWTKNHDFLPFNVKHSKTTVFENFVKEFPDVRTYFKIKMMKRYMEEYCKFYGKTYTEGNDRTIGRWFMISTIAVEAAENIDFPADYSYEPPDLF